MCRDARPAPLRWRLALRTASGRQGTAGGDSAQPVVLMESPDPTVGSGLPSAPAPCSPPPGPPGTAVTARCTALSSSYNPATALGILVPGGARCPRAAGTSRPPPGESALLP